MLSTSLKTPNFRGQFAKLAHLIKLDANAPMLNTTSAATSFLVPLSWSSLSNPNSIKIRLVTIPKKQNNEVRNDQRTITN